jgi:hypothetical protein
MVKNIFETIYKIYSDRLVMNSNDIRFKIFFLVKGYNIMKV